MRKLFFNVGFQFNYGEPFALRNFYNATYFQNPFGGSRDLKYGNSTDNIESEDTVSGTNRDGRAMSRGFDESNDLLGSDLTAAQLYESIEDNFME